MLHGLGQPALAEVHGLPHHHRRFHLGHAVANSVLVHERPGGTVGAHGATVQCSKQPVEGRLVLAARKLECLLLHVGVVALEDTAVHQPLFDQHCLRGAVLAVHVDELHAGLQHRLQRVVVDA